MSEEKNRIVESINPDALDDTQEFVANVTDQVGPQYPQEVPIYLRSCYDIDKERFVPNSEPMTLERFIEVADLVIQDAHIREGIPEDRRIQLIEDYPAENFSRFGDTVIVWRLKARQPANMNSNASGRKQPGFTYDRSQRSPLNPNQILSVESRPVDNRVEFAVWSKYARMANEKALWLERLFVNYKWAFEIQGAERFFWKDRGPDTYQVTNGQRLYVRPLTFEVRLREFRTKADTIIQQFNFDLQSSSGGQFLS